VHAVWTDAMQGSSRFAYDVLLQLVRSISNRWNIALKAEEIKSFRALVVAFLTMTRTAGALMRSHALAQGLVYGTGILIVIDALDAIAQVPPPLPFNHCDRIFCVLIFFRYHRAATTSCKLLPKCSLRTCALCAHAGMTRVCGVGLYSLFMLAMYRWFWLLLSVESYCRPSSIERRARRVLKHAKIVPVRGIDSKEKAESFIREARWVMGIKDVTIDIGCAMQGLKAGVEVEPSWLMACVRERECR
jgi:hypothetical protein